MKTSLAERPRSMKSTLILVSMSFFALAACTDREELTRVQAEDLLRAGLEFPQYATSGDIWYRYTFFTSGRNAISLEGEKEKLARLESTGFGTGSINMLRESSYRVEIELSERMKPYDTGKTNTNGRGKDAIRVFVYEADLLDVTGIAFNGERNRAIVEYRVKYVPTPVLEFASGFRKRTTDIETRKANLVLYDDGWRVAER